MAKVKKYIKSTWETMDIGKPTKIISIEIFLGENSISISQQNYISDILWQEHMLTANPVKTPLEPNPDSTNGNWSNSFAQLLGKLQWVADVARPDVAYAVNKLATYTAYSSLQHVTASKQILQYLAGTKNFGTTYQINPDNNNSIGNPANLFYGYTDELKSTSGDKNKINAVIELLGWIKYHN